MRRLFMFAGIAAVVGCADVRDLFTAHADVAAEAGAHTLGAQRLADIIAGGKAREVTRGTAEFVASSWVDYSLFAQSLARGDSLTDSATIAQAMWPAIAELRGLHWHDTLLVRRGDVTPAMIDSVYRGDEVRVFQHILFQVPPPQDEAARTATREKAAATLEQIRDGADFGQLARELSSDGSAADRGFLQPARRGDFVAEFEEAGWELEPGGLSGVVETQFGYHLIRRPPLDEVRARLLRYLTGSNTARDSVYMDSLTTAYHLEVVDDAPALARAAFEDLDGSRTSGDEVATFEGGGLTVAELVRWVQALPPQYADRLGTLNDDQLRDFVRVVAQNVLFLRQADSAGIRLTADEWTWIQRDFRDQVDSLRSMLDIPPGQGDTALTERERVDLAAVKVEGYFKRLVEGTARFRPLPAALAAVLRDRMEYEIHPAGLSRSIELADGIRRAAQDSAAAASIRPAPGGPPVPGGAAVPADTAVTQGK